MRFFDSTKAGTANTAIYNELISQARAAGNNEYADMTTSWEPSVSGSGNNYDVSTPPSNILEAVRSGLEYQGNTINLCFEGDSIINAVMSADKATDDILISDQIKATDSKLVVNIENSAVNGSAMYEVRNRMDANLTAWQAKYDFAYVVVCVGTNNVSALKWYNTAQGFLDEHEGYYTAALDKIVAAGFQPIIANIPYGGNAGLSAIDADERLGGKDWNTNMINDLCATYCPDFTYEDGTPLLDLYTMTKNNHVQSELDNAPAPNTAEGDAIRYINIDDIHLTTAGRAAYRSFIINTIVSYITTGIKPTQLTAV